MRIPGSRVSAKICLRQRPDLLLALLKIDRRESSRGCKSVKEV